jgi:hypothetical protein
MIVLETIFHLWIVIGMLVGLLDTKYFVIKIRLGDWPKKLWIIFCLGPFWWFIIPVISFTNCITK